MIEISGIGHADLDNTNLGRSSLQDALMKRYIPKGNIKYVPRLSNIYDNKIKVHKTRYSTSG